VTYFTSSYVCSSELFFEIIADLASIEVYDLFDIVGVITECSTKVSVLREMRSSLNFWQRRLAVSRPRLDSYDLTEYFVHINNTTEHHRVRLETNQSIRDGQLFMLRHDGRVISTPDAVVCLNRYPIVSLISPFVQTTSRPEYDKFDAYGELVESASNRREVLTMTLPEMLVYCDRTGNAIPAQAAQDQAQEL
jgi:hypothetical protein